MCANNLWWVRLVRNHLLYSSRTVTCYIWEDQTGKLPARQGKGICAVLEAISNPKVSAVGAYSFYSGTTRTYDCRGTHFQHASTFKHLEIYSIPLADDRFVSRLWEWRQSYRGSVYDNKKAFPPLQNVKSNEDHAFLTPDKEDRA